jgi:hypothetical protein
LGEAAFFEEAIFLTLGLTAFGEAGAVPPAATALGFVVRFLATIFFAGPAATFLALRNELKG